MVDAAALDARIQALWGGLKDALRSGDITRAVTFIHSESREAYRAQFVQLGATILANIDRWMTTIQVVDVGFGGAEYEILRVRDGQTLSFPVWFQLDEDGLWRVVQF